MVVFEFKDFVFSTVHLPATYAPLIKSAHSPYQYAPYPSTYPLPMHIPATLAHTPYPYACTYPIVIVWVMSRGRAVNSNTNKHSFSSLR